MTRDRALGVAAVAIALAASRTAPADGPLLRTRGDARLRLGATANAHEPDALLAPLPARAFAAPPVRVDLPGALGAEPRVAADGSLVVAIASPPSIAWVMPDGRVRGSVALDERPARQDLALGADGRVFVMTEAPALEVVAPDLTVRNALAVGTPTFVGPVARGDGAVFVASNPAALGGELTVVPPDGGEPVRRALPARVIDGPWIARSGQAWVLLVSGAVTVGADGRVLDAGFGRGATRMTLVGDDTIAVESGTVLEFRTLGGALRGRLDAGPIESRWPLPGGTLAILHAGTPQELWLVNRDGVVTARAAVPAAHVNGVLADPTGALLVSTASGELTALERDGTPRWSLVLHDTLVRAPVALRGGGVALAPGAGGLVLVR